MHVLIPKIYVPISVISRGRLQSGDVLDNFQCRNILLIWLIVGLGPAILAVGAGGLFGRFFLSPILSLSFLSAHPGRRLDID